MEAARRRSHANYLAFALTVGALVTAAAPRSAAPIHSPRTVPPAAARLSQHLPGMRVPFVAAAADDRSRVRFSAATFAGTTLVTDTSEIVYALGRRDRGPNGVTELPAVVLQERFLGGRPATPAPGSRGATTVNILRGRDPSRWRRNLPSYDAIRLDGIYDGIGIELRAYGGSVEKVFTVKPGTTPDTIRIGVGGASTLAVNARGELEVATARGAIAFSRPVAYQLIDGARRTVDVTYAVDGTAYGFALGAYDRTVDLVIDPLLSASYVGGSGGEGVSAVTADSAGNVYAAGIIFEPVDPPDFPGNPSADILQEDKEGFVAKFDSTLETLLVATYLGGSDADIIGAIAVDASDNVYVGGATWSADFPGIGGLSADSTLGGTSDAFVAWFDPTFAFFAATFVGGTGSAEPENPGEMVRAMTFSLTGDLVIVGYTHSADFPGINELSPDAAYAGYNEAFVATMDPGLGVAPVSTFLGGSSCESADAVDVDPETGAIFVGGFTRSSNFPFLLNDAADSSFDGESEAWVARLDSSLVAPLPTVTFLGGTDEFYREVVTGLQVVGVTVYVAGDTFAKDFPGISVDAVDDYNHDGDGFVLGLATNLKGIQAGTFLGGNTWDFISSLVVLESGEVFVSGSTMSFQEIPDAQDGGYHGCVHGDDYQAYVASFDAGLQELLSFTCLEVGSEGWALGAHDGNVYMGGVARAPLSLVEPVAGDPTKVGDEGFVTLSSPGLNVKGFFYNVSVLQDLLIRECRCPDYLQNILTQELIQATNHAQKSHVEAASKAMLRFIATIEKEIVAEEATAALSSTARSSRSGPPLRGIPLREAQQFMQLARVALADLPAPTATDGRSFNRLVLQGLRTVSRDCACQAATVIRRSAGFTAGGIPSCEACVRNVCSATPEIR